MRKLKMVSAVILTVVFFINGAVVSFKQPFVNFGISRAEAFDWHKLANIGQDLVMAKTAHSILKHLSKASEQMSYAKIMMAEAVEMEPEKIQGARQIMFAIAKNPNSLNAISMATNIEISHEEIERRIANMDVTDPTRFTKVQSMFKEAQLARHAAHKNNAAAIAKATALIGIIAKRAHDDPDSLDDSMKTYLQVGLYAKQLADEQSVESGKLKFMMSEFNSRWKVKEPTDKEVKKFEKRFDKELKPQ